MLYLYLNENKIKLFVFKKTLLGQYEAAYFSKKHEANLLNDGVNPNIDLVASAIKEALTTIGNNSLGEKELYLILPQKLFDFLRIEVPKDINQTAVESFIKDKIRTVLGTNENDVIYDYLINENYESQEILLFCLKKDIIKIYQKVLNLLDLKFVSTLPDTLSYFKLFEKTLRREKREKILYVHYDKDDLIGYLYDSVGLLSKEAFFMKIDNSTTFEESLKQKVKEIESQGIKLNRIILSGKGSENIRQDTFTKTIGVWINLLKRITPNFYQDYLKLIITDKNQPIPLLELDECFGAFIFFKEEKNFLIDCKKNIVNKNSALFPHLSFKLPLKEIAIFIISFILSFALFSFLSQKQKSLVLNFKYINKEVTSKKIASPSPTLTLTPTPSIAKDKIKIKVLNGSGIKGKALVVKEILESKGYQEILTGNADSFDYKTTEIKAKKNQLFLINAFKNDLKDYSTATISEELDAQENADVIIIIGQDFK